MEHLAIIQTLNNYVRMVAVPAEPDTPKISEQWDLWIEGWYDIGGWMPLYGYGTHFGSLGELRQDHGDEIAEALRNEYNQERPARWSQYDVV